MLEKSTSSTSIVSMILIRSRNLPSTIMAPSSRRRTAGSRPCPRASRRRLRWSSWRARPARRVHRPDPDVSADHPRPAVLVGHLGLDGDVIGLRVERVDEGRVLLRDESPSQFAGPGYLLVIRVELLVQDEVLPDLRAPQELVLTEAPVDPNDLRVDQVVDLRLLGEVGVARVRDVPPLRPAADGGEVDVDHGGSKGTPLADAHGLLDVRRELALVLDVLRREQRAVHEPADVLRPIDDLEVPVVVDEARIPGVDPPVFHHLAGRLLVLVVPQELPRAAKEHLALLGDPDLHLGDRCPHRVEPRLPVPLDGDEDTGLRHAVELLDVDPERAEEQEDLGPDGL